MKPLRIAICRGPITPFITIYTRSPSCIFLLQQKWEVDLVKDHKTFTTLANSKGGRCLPILDCRKNLGWNLLKSNSKTPWKSNVWKTKCFPFLAAFWPIFRGGFANVLLVFLRSSVTFHLSTMLEVNTWRLTTSHDRPRITKLPKIKKKKRYLILKNSHINAQECLGNVKLSSCPAASKTYFMDSGKQASFKFLNTSPLRRVNPFLNTFGKWLKTWTSERKLLNFWTACDVGPPATAQKLFVTCIFSL